MLGQGRVAEQSARPNLGARGREACEEVDVALTDGQRMGPSLGGESTCQAWAFLGRTGSVGLHMIPL